MEDFNAKFHYAISSSLPVLKLNVQLRLRFSLLNGFYNTVEPCPEVMIQLDNCHKIVGEILIKHRQLGKMMKSLREIKRMVEEEESVDVVVDDDESNDDDVYESSDDEGFNEDDGFDSDEEFDEEEDIECDFSDEGFRESTLDEFIAVNREVQQLNGRLRVILDYLYSKV